MPERLRPEVTERRAVLLDVVEEHALLEDGRHGLGGRRDEVDRPPVAARGRPAAQSLEQLGGARDGALVEGRLEANAEEVPDPGRLRHEVGVVYVPEVGRPGVVGELPLVRAHERVAIAVPLGGGRGLSHDAAILTGPLILSEGRGPESKGVAECDARRRERRPGAARTLAARAFAVDTFLILDRP